MYLPSAQKILSLNTLPARTLPEAPKRTPSGYLSCATSLWVALAKFDTHRLVYLTHLALTKSNFCTLLQDLSFFPSFSSCTSIHTLFTHSVPVVHAAGLVEDDRRLSYCDKPLFKSFLDRNCLDLSFLSPLSALLEPADPTFVSSSARGDGRYTGR